MTRDIKGHFSMMRLPKYFKFNANGNNRLRISYEDVVDMSQALKSILKIQEIGPHPCLDSLLLYLVEDFKPVRIYMICCEWTTLEECPEIAYPTDVAVQILLDIGYGLDFLHSNKISHNDVTAKNVMLHDFEHSRLSGFENCKELESEVDALKDYTDLVELATNMLARVVEMRKSDPKVVNEKDEPILEKKTTHEVVISYIGMRPLSQSLARLALPFSEGFLHDRYNEHSFQVMESVKESYVTKAKTQYPPRYYTIKHWEKKEFNLPSRRALTKDELSSLKGFGMHAHVVSIFDFFYENDIPTGYVMADGKCSLTKAIEDYEISPYGEKLLKVITEHLALALEYLGKNNIVHGAIRMEHVVCTSWDTFQLCSMDTIFTETRDTWLAYLAPETIDSSERSKDPRSDIYSLGVLLASVIQPWPPFDDFEGTSNDLAEAIQNGRLPFPVDNDPLGREGIPDLIFGCCMPLEERWTIDKILDNIDNIEEFSLGERPYLLICPNWILPLDYEKGVPVEKIYTRNGRTYSRRHNPTTSTKTRRRIRVGDTITLEIKRSCSFKDDPICVYITKPGDIEFNWTIRDSDAAIHVRAFHHLKTCEKSISFARDKKIIWMFVDETLKECYECLLEKPEIFVIYGDDFVCSDIGKEKTVQSTIKKIDKWVVAYKKEFREIIQGLHRMNRDLVNSGPHCFFKAISEEYQYNWTSRPIHVGEKLCLLVKKGGVDGGSERIKLMFAEEPITDRRVWDRQFGGMPKTGFFRLFEMSVDTKASDIMIYIDKDSYLVVVQDGHLKQHRFIEGSPLFFSIKVKEDCNVDFQLLSVPETSECESLEKFSSQDWNFSSNFDCQRYLRIRQARYDIKTIRSMQYSKLIESAVQLGEGNFARVLSCQTERRNVAIKVFNANKTTEIDIIEEIKMAASLSSPYLVDFLAVLTKEETVMGIVLELMHGDLWNSVICQENLHYNDVRICDWMIQVAEGLDYLHEKQLVHRDIKPMNILIRNYFNVKLGDLGSVTTADKETKRLATPKYSAPEFSEKSQSMTIYRPSYDIYSFGITLWDVVNRDIDGRLNAQFLERTSRLTFLDDTRIIDWRSMIEKCTQVDCEQRPSTADLSMELQCMRLSLAF